MFYAGSPFHFQALQGSLRVEVGDWVKLAPATGETQDTIGQLQVPSSCPHACPSRATLITCLALYLASLSLSVQAVPSTVACVTSLVPAQQQALWAERPVDGQPRMLARCRRLYRPQVRLGPLLLSWRPLMVLCLRTLPSCRQNTACIRSNHPCVGLQETVFMSTGSAAELFMSDHIEARVPVADITAKSAPNTALLVTLKIQEYLAKLPVLLHQCGIVDSSPHAR